MAIRKAGPHKSSASVRENFLAVFTRLGGTAAMARWAKKNETEFYKLYGKLLPTSLEGSGEFTITYVPAPTDDTI